MRVEVVDMDVNEKVEILATNWWAVLLRGLCSMLFGILMFVAPVVSLAALVILYGAYVFADGLFSIISALRRRGSTQAWGTLIFRGVLGIAAGLVAFGWPGITALVLLYIIAAWAVLGGVTEIVAAVRLRKAIEHEWLLAFSGLTSVALGALLIAYPGPGAVALMFWIGAFCFVSGTILAVLSFKLRSWHKSHPHAQFSPA